MLKCNRCKQYYIPGYLDCACRTSLRAPRPSVLPLRAQERVTPKPSRSLAEDERENAPTPGASKLSNSPAISHAT
jgi:hypothetical protein